MTPPAPIQEKLRALEHELASLPNPQARLAWVTQRGRRAPPFPEKWKDDAHLVPGCLAKTWFAADIIENRCVFHADSESAVIKGIAVLLCDFFSGQTSEEIVSIDPGFLEKYGIDQHLAPNRRNSLSKLFQEIRRFAASMRQP